MKLYQIEWAVFLAGLITILVAQALTPMPWTLLFIPVAGAWGHYTDRLTRVLFAGSFE